MIYLRKFENENEYYNYLASHGYIKPNVSYVEGAEKKIANYNKTVVAVVYDVLQPQTTTWLLTNPASFSKMIINGNQYDLMPRATFSTAGERTILYELKDGVTSLAEQTFYKIASAQGVDNVRVKDIILPPEITSIGKWAFARCELEEYSFPDTITSLPASPGIFYRPDKTTADATLKKVHFGKGIVSIPSYSIVHQPAVEEVTWTNNLKRIETYGLGTDIYCRNEKIETLNLGKGIEYVGSNAVAQTSLKNLIIPCDHVLEILGDSFSGTYIGSLPGASGSHKIGDAFIYVPDSLVDAYKAHSSWGQYLTVEDRTITFKGLSELPTELDKFMYKD